MMYGEWMPNPSYKSSDLSNYMEYTMPELLIFRIAWEVEAKSTKSLVPFI